MAELTVTAKIKLHTSPEQEEFLSRTMHAYREACNFVSEHVYRTHDLAQASLNKSLYHELRARFGLKSQMAQSVIKTVIAKYKAMRSNGHGWAEAVFRLPQLDLVWNRDYSLNGKLFSVNTLDGRLKLPYAEKGMERYFTGDYRFGTAKLVYRHGKYFLHVPATCNVPDASLESVSCVVGVDLGINFLTASYDSSGKSRFFSGRAAKQKQAHYRALRKELQMRQTASSRKRLKAIGERENRWMSDVCHQASKALVSSYPKDTLFILEDLSGIHGHIKEQVYRKDGRSMLVSWAFYRMGQYISYKAARNGQSVVFLNRAYTSQACPKCGHVEKGNRNKKKHLFRCKNCGYQSNDDRAAAMNLYRMGITVPGTGVRGHVLRMWGTINCPVM